MTAIHQRQTPVEHIAAQWFARERSGAMDRAERAELIAWLKADPAHQSEYRKLEHAWALTGKAAGHEDIRAMRAAALASSEPDKPTYGLRRALVAMILLTLGAVSVWFVTGERSTRGHTPPANSMYSTSVGERSTVTLEDGSTVVLNTQTRMRVDFNGAARDVVLFEGQALFDVAQDSRRAFIVHAGDRRIVALGTAFDVRVNADDVRVTLLSGRVAVDPGRIGEAENPRRAELTPGQQWVASKGRAESVRPTDVSKATSWREGRLIFDNEPLANVIAEVNRYSRRQIVLRDSTLESLRISGTFLTGSTANFLTALGEYFPIEASAEQKDGDYLLSWRAAR